MGRRGGVWLVEGFAWDVVGPRFLVVCLWLAGVW
jgi:hypothetical protein